MKMHYTRSDITVVVDQNADEMAQAIASVAGQLDRQVVEALPPWDDFHIRRVALDVRGRDLAGFPWETVIANALESRTDTPYVITRVSPTCPRALQIPLTFPLRVLEINDVMGHDAHAAADIHRAFRGAEWSQAMHAGVASLRHAEDFVTASEWPTVDILQCSVDWIEESALRMSVRDNPGTAGWLEAMATQWQTRLVILESDQSYLPRLRRLAHMLVSRGGPAVWVSDRRTGLQRFYDFFVHDRPLDFIRGLYREHEVALFAGGGREEALRFSAIGETLSRPEVASAIRIAAAPHPWTRYRDVVTLPELGLIESDMQTYVFEDHETEGVLPLARHVRSLKRFAGPRVREARATAAALSTAERYVNTAFYDVSPSGELEQIPQESRLTPGSLVHFGVQIGPKNELITTFGATALVEEIFRWKSESTDAWIEIGLTPLDFENLGDDVQHVRLAVAGPTDLVTFALLPRLDTTVPGVARLRVSLYFENHVVQTWRVAAVLESATDFPVPLLARALDLTMDEVEREGAFGYASRLEYANVGSVDECASLPRRTLSIVANESAGEKVVTMKADDYFTNVADRTLGGKVTNARLALKNASEDAKGVYRYLDKNRGNETDLAKSLLDLAEEGWNLCSSVMVDRARREVLRDQLDRQQTIVQVANVDITKVIPWSLMYDREIDRKHRHFDRPGVAASEVLVEHGLCSGGIPNEEGKMPPGDCGTAPKCLLDPAENASKRARGEKIYCPESVVCPRRFWGFKYEIEMPAQQVKSGQSGSAVATTINTVGPPQVFAAFNRHLRFAEPHQTALRKTVTDAAAGLIDPLQYDAALIRDVLKLDPAADVIYFYCHGRPESQDAAGRFIESALDFGNPLAEDGLRSVDFDGVNWSHAPLVFLNGCDTVGGFTPNVPAELIGRFIAGRKASAVIGTEVTIWELLAGEMARQFLSRFLAGRAAGAALLEARRALLGLLNPLGLVYSLYGSADLMIRRLRD